MSEALPDTPDIIKPDLDSVEMGYVESGHGLKGRKMWMEMLKKCTTTTVASQLFVYGVTRAYKQKSRLPDLPKNLLKSTSKNEDKQKEVDDIYVELQKKHEGSFSPEQLRAWSHMIRLKTHDSLDKPPDKPFFRGHKSKTIDNGSPSGKAPESKRQAVAISPGKKLNMRSELINQLEKWHQLLDSCVIGLGLDSQTIPGCIPVLKLKELVVLPSSKLY